MFYDENLQEKIQYTLINSLTDKDLIDRLTWLLVNVTKGNMANFEAKIILLIPQLTKIFKICISDKKTDMENQLLSDNNKNKLHIAQFSEKTFEHILWILINIANLELPKSALLDNSVHESLLSILTVDENKTNKLIWKILGDFACAEDLKIQMLIKAGICDIILSYLYKDFSTFGFSILKEVVFILSNIACGTISQVRELINKGIIKRIWELVKLFNEADFNDPDQINNNKMDAIKAYRECIYVIVFAIEGSLDANRVEIIDAANASDCDIAYILVSAMLYFNQDIDLIYRILKAVQILIVLEENTMDLEVENNPFFFKESLEKNGIHAILKKYENTENNNLYQLIENLNEEFSAEQT